MVSDTANRSSRGTEALVWGIVWVISYFGARMALEQMGEPQPDLGRIVVALMPLLPFMAFLWKFISFMRAADELERRIQLEALAIAFPLAMVLLMVLALVQLATPLNPNDWSYRHVWYFLPIFWFGGLSIAKRRYQ